MTTSEGSNPRASPFLSVFSRKKRINGTKSVDNLKSAAELRPHYASDFIDSDKEQDEDLSNGISINPQTTVINALAGSQKRISPSTTLIDKIKSSRSRYRLGSNSKSEVTSPQHSSTLPNRPTDVKRVKNDIQNQQKWFSADTVLSSCPTYLTEALETLAEDQPRVARSIPKHATVDTSDFAEKSLRNCLFDSTVYDNMLCDSLKVCELLQNHLEQCIDEVRTQSAEGLRLHRKDEEDERSSESTATKTSSRLTVKLANDSKRISASTNDTNISSIDDEHYLSSDSRNLMEFPNSPSFI